MSFSAGHIIRGVARLSTMHAIVFLDVEPAQVPPGQTRWRPGSLVLSLLGLGRLSAVLPASSLQASSLRSLCLAASGPKHQTAERRRISFCLARPVSAHQLNRRVSSAR
jgi:hypothetical protein